MTRKEYEKQQMQERDARFDAAMRYRDKPHSFRGNLLRIRMAGGKLWCIWVFAVFILLLWGSAVLLMYHGIFGEPIAEENLTQKTFILDSYRLNWGGRGGPYYSFYDSDGIEYHIPDADSIVSDPYCVKGAEVTVGIGRTSRNKDKISAACVTMSIDSKTFVSYEDYVWNFENDRSMAVGLSCVLTVLGLLLGFWFVTTVCHMDNHPKFICGEFVLRQLPPTWEQVIKLEEKSYLRRHGNDGQPKKDHS